MNKALRIHSPGKRIHYSMLCCATILLMMLSACGQTGPLTLPEDTETAPAVAEQDAEEAQKTGNEDEDRDGTRR